MRKCVMIFMISLLLCALTACSNTTNSEKLSSPTFTQNIDSSSSQAEETDNQKKVSSSTPPEEKSLQAKNKSLVVYFSWSGNTQSVAEIIQSETVSDSFEIIPITPYSDDYDTVVELAQEEQRKNARPAISGNIENLAQYDVVFVGYPNWWGDMPMILYTFFDTYDLSGKIIAPFCTSGGSGLSNTINTIKSLEPNATIIDGLHMDSSSLSEADNAVHDWLKKNNIQ